MFIYEQPIRLKVLPCHCHCQHISNRKFHLLDQNRVDYFKQKNYPLSLNNIVLICAEKGNKTQQVQIFPTIDNTAMI